MNDVNRILLFFLYTGRLEKQVVRLKSLYMKELGLKGSDLSVLLFLATHPGGLRMEELCALTAVDKSQVSRALLGCRKAGLVCKEDGRAYKNRYFLSRQGEEICRVLSREAEGILQNTHQELDDASWQAFYQFMDQLSGSVEDMITEMEKPSRNTEFRERIAQVQRARQQDAD